MLQARVGTWSISCHGSKLWIFLPPKIQRIIRQHRPRPSCQHFQGPQELGDSQSGCVHQLFKTGEVAKAPPHLGLAMRIKEAQGCLRFEFCTVRSKRKGSPSVPTTSPATVRESADENIPRQHHQDTPEFGLQAHSEQAALIIGADGSQHRLLNDGIHKRCNRHLNKVGCGSDHCKRPHGPFIDPKVWKFARHKSARRDDSSGRPDLGFLQTACGPFDECKPNQWGLLVKIVRRAKRRTPARNACSDWRCNAFLDVELASLHQSLQIHYLQDQFQHLTVKIRLCCDFSV